MSIELRLRRVSMDRPILVGAVWLVQVVVAPIGVVMMLSALDGVYTKYLALWSTVLTYAIGVLAFCAVYQWERCTLRKGGELSRIRGVIAVLQGSAAGFLTCSMVYFLTIFTLVTFDPDHEFMLVFVPLVCSIAFFFIITSSLWSAARINSEINLLAHEQGSDAPSVFL